MTQLTIGIGENGFKRKIRSVLFEGTNPNGWKSEIGLVGERDTGIPGEFGGIKEDKFVNPKC